MSITEIAEQYIAALYQHLIMLDVFTEMEKIQEILNLIRSIRETMIIIQAPTPAPSPVPAYAAETMVVPAITMPQLPPYLPAENDARFNARVMAFDSTGYPAREVQ